MTESQAFKLARAFLQNEKFLLLVDNRQPSLVTLLTGESIKGSWFGHKMGHAIYNTANRLSSRPELLGMKLIDGKYTYIAPELRDAAYAFTAGAANWQKKKLTPSAKKLLGTLKRRSSVPVTAEIKKDAQLLEKLLLAAAVEEHTPSGKHVKVLITWERHAKKAKHRIKKVELAEAERLWELRVNEFNKKHGSTFRLPWQRR